MPPSSRRTPVRQVALLATLLGVGWAIAGTCPAPALVMVSSGAMLGLVAIPGIFLGLHLRERQQHSGQHVGDGEHRTTVASGR